MPEAVNVEKVLLPWRVQEGEYQLTESSSTGSAAHRPSPSRRRIVNASNLLVLIVTVVAALWGMWWLYDRLTNVYVLDARISSDMLLLSSQVSGQIVAIPVNETDHVAAGEPLVRIDDREARAHLQELEAGLSVLGADTETLSARINLVDNQTLSHLQATQARLQAAESELAAGQGDLEVAEADWKRAQALRAKNLLSQQEYESTRNTWRSAVQTVRRHKADVATARADLAEAKAGRAEVSVLRSQLDSMHKQRVQTEHQIEQARTELEYHTITSPTNGVVDELFVDPGEHVAASQRVLVMHDPRRLRVKANVKETDLRYFRLGDPATIDVDAYPGKVYRGKVVRIGDAATSEFALLPNPNPSGNFTKITQRVKVTIKLEDPDPLLKPGMMVEVKIPHRS